MADLTRPKFLACIRCGRQIKVRAKGRLPRYCTTRSCRQMHFVTRQRQAQAKAPPVTDDERHRRALWDALREFGLVKGDMPPKPQPENG